MDTITPQCKEHQLPDDENGKFYGSTTRSSMSYKGFITDGKVQTDTYGELTYKISGDLFKEKGKFDHTFKLTSGKRDTRDGEWKMTGEM